MFHMNIVSSSHELMFTFNEHHVTYNLHTVYISDQLSGYNGTILNVSLPAQWPYYNILATLDRTNWSTHPAHTVTVNSFGSLLLSC